MTRFSAALFLALLPTTAQAVDLNSLVESWTQIVAGPGGQAGVDEAAAVTINGGRDIVVAGWIDGMPGHQDDAYVATWDRDGTLEWDITEDAGPIGPGRSSSVDRFYDVSTESLALFEDVVLCGTVSDEGQPGHWGGFYVQQRLENFGYAPEASWFFDYVDGIGSELQECRAVRWHDGTVYAAGWADSGTEEGRWLTWRLDESDGAPPGPALTADFNQFPAVPDQALDMHLDTVTGNFAVVGVRGFAGAIGSDLSDSDWHVRMYDPAGLLMWEATHQGSDDLDDRALAVTMDVASGDVFVVGQTNTGANNGTGVDYDWLIKRYARDGDGYGGPLTLWTQTFESAPGASEGATSITFDEFGDPMVGGWSIDAASGLEQWRIAVLAAYDGVELQEWLGPVQAGDSRIADLEFDGEVVAIAGTIHNGTDPDFAATMLEGDSDGDGFGDSVDACPDDNNKWEDEGICGCGDFDDDSDGDGAINCEEDCPTDPYKLEAGVCGCDEPDDDSDGDGTEDCIDDCPDDPDKIARGVCGCGAADADTDGDGVLGCDDACANTEAGATVDEFGCSQAQRPTEDTGDTGLFTDASDDDKGGCGCSSSASAGSIGIIAGIMVTVMALRRRRP